MTFKVMTSWRLQPAVFVIRKIIRGREGLTTEEDVMDGRVG